MLHYTVLSYTFRTLKRSGNICMRVYRYHVIAINDCFSADHSRQSPGIVTSYSTRRYDALTYTLAPG